MSLKAFHLVFILVSVALSVWFGFWSLGEFETTSETTFLIYSALSFMSGIGLSVYLVSFLRKTRGFSFLSFLLGFLLVPESLWACSVCWGDPNHPMTQGANAGVTFLLYVITALLVVFAALFIFWMRRAKSMSS